MHLICGVVALFAFSLSGTATANDMSALEGHWRTVKHGAEVRISDCGDGSPCGYLVSVSNEISNGHTRDVRNRRSELRTRPLKGLPILWGFSPSGTTWRRGRLYNPETGQTFSSSLDLIADDALLVKGCLGPLCRNQIWTRISKQDASRTKEQAND